VSDDDVVRWAVIVFVVAELSVAAFAFYMAVTS